MHHLECRFDFALLRDQLAGEGDQHDEAVLRFPVPEAGLHGR